MKFFLRYLTFFSFFLNPLAFFSFFPSFKIQHCLGNLRESVTFFLHKECRMIGASIDQSSRCYLWWKFIHFTFYIVIVSFVLPTKISFASWIGKNKSKRNFHPPTAQILRPLSLFPPPSSHFHLFSFVQVSRVFENCAGNWRKSWYCWIWSEIHFELVAQRRRVGSANVKFRQFFSIWIGQWVPSGTRPALKTNISISIWAKCFISGGAHVLKYDCVSSGRAKSALNWEKGFAMCEFWLFCGRYVGEEMWNDALRIWCCLLWCHDLILMIS